MEILRPKITKELIGRMEKLRKKGYSYGDISLALGISTDTALYHLNDEYRKKVKKRASKYSKDNYYKTIKKKRKYLKEYQKRRYKENGEFREKQKKRIPAHRRRGYINDIDPLQCKVKNENMNPRQCRI